MGKGERWQVWLAIAGMVLGALTYAVSVAATAGRLEERLVTVEKAQTHSISRDEWNLFTQDTRDRLNRIEEKIDRQTSLEGRR